MVTKSRGDIKHGKSQVNWRLSTELIEKCKAEAKRLGLSSIPMAVSYILTQYFNKKGE
uniref:Uncharacterized protein n=1 Tax=viral metagenome TaxID=1070528 RepID=A0A6M3KFB3_9ZZZZ